MSLKRFVGIVSAIVVAVATAIVPSTAALAASAYDAQTQSGLHNLSQAMQCYALTGDGTYNGVSYTDLQNWGFTNGSSTHTEIYVLPGGTAYWASGDDTQPAHNSTQSHPVAASSAIPAPV